MPGKSTLYSLLRERARAGARLCRIVFGLNWTVADSDAGAGLCFSPVGVPRNIDWPGTLAGRRVEELLPWLHSAQDIEVAAAVAAVNASLNGPDNPQLQAARPLLFEAAPHLSVFQHFAAQLDGARVVVIGRYPGIAEHLPGFEFRCVERRPGPGDLPEEAAQSELGKADWAFITASSLANGTLPDLLRWSRNARTVLMGPSMPWLAEWADFGVDFIAGVETIDRDQLWQVAAEAGGTRIFTGPVRYRLLQLP